MMRLLNTDRRENLTVRIYLHPTRGVVRTLAMVYEPNVIHVGGPNFGSGERVRADGRVKQSKRKPHRKRARGCSIKPAASHRPKPTMLGTNCAN
jgi:hypothetical protein